MIPGQALPSGWCWTTLGEIASIQGGIQKQPKRAPTDNAFPFLRVANVMRGKLELGDVHRVQLFGDELDRLRLEAGDLLIVEGNGSPSEIGRLAIWDGSIKDCVHQNHIIRARLRKHGLPAYVAAYWNSADGARALLDLASSTSGLYTLSVSKVSGLAIPFAPPAEQHRMVSEIESQFSRLDVAVAALQRISRLLVRFRLAVSTAALSGRFHKTDLHSWRTKSVSELLAEPLANGRSVPDRDGGFPVLRLTCLKAGRVDLGARKCGDWSADDAKRSLVVRGDFFVARGNGSLSLVGRGALVEDQPDPVAFPDTLIRVRPDPKLIEPRFLRLCWNSAGIRKQVEASARTSAGIWKISQADIISFKLLVPPLDEQTEIAECAEQLFDFADRLEAIVKKAIARAGSLRQAILKRAFEGRLVPQDPNDEPAEVLLRRASTNGRSGPGTRAAVEGK